MHTHACYSISRRDLSKGYKGWTASYELRHSLVGLKTDDPSIANDESGDCRDPQATGAVPIGIHRFPEAS